MTQVLSTMITSMKNVEQDVKLTLRHTQYMGKGLGKTVDYPKKTEKAHAIIKKASFDK